MSGYWERCRVYGCGWVSGEHSERESAERELMGHMSSDHLDRAHGEYEVKIQDVPSCGERLHQVSRPFRSSWGTPRGGVVSFETMEFVGAASERPDGRASFSWGPEELHWFPDVPAALDFIITRDQDAQTGNPR